MSDTKLRCPECGGGLCKYEGLLVCEGFSDRFIYLEVAYCWRGVTDGVARGKREQWTTVNLMDSATMPGEEVSVAVVTVGGDFFPAELIIEVDGPCWEHPETLESLDEVKTGDMWTERTIMEETGDE